MSFEPVFGGKSQTKIQPIIRKLIARDVEIFPTIAICDIIIRRDGAGRGDTATLSPSRYIVIGATKFEQSFCSDTGNHRPFRRDI